MECKNCNNEFVGNYCNECGQKVMDRLTIKSLWRLIVDDVFEIDKGLLYTVKQLWISPGKTALDFIHGRTKKYYSPLKYLIFWTAIYFILISLLDFKDHESKSIKNLVFNSSRPFSPESFDDFGNLYLEVISRYLDLFYFGMILFLKIVSYFIYRKRGFFFTELSVLYIYLLGQLVLILTLSIPLVYLFNNIAIYMLLPEMIVVLYLLFKSHKEFFADTWIKTIIKSLAILYIGQLIYGATAYVALNLIKI
ncbi:MAG TPA: DUF3667 domain-containing protein [Cyclobacteriaceae bacterium]|nr:DUF3667 domain-containing protein [Cyclobacteriaceae bacterium]